MGLLQAPAAGYLRTARGTPGGRRKQVNPSGEEAFGMLYAADIIAFEPELHREIEQVLFLDELPRDLKPWTYPMIQPKLVEEAKRRNLV